MAFGRKPSVPETNSHTMPMTNEPPGFIKKSEHVGAGHQDHPHRMPHPNAEWVNEESGEGKNK